LEWERPPGGQLAYQYGYPNRFLALKIQEIEAAGRSIMELAIRQ
jgi:hypothetical protein